MNRRLLLLLVLVVLAAALVDLGVSRALYTTSSTTKITATADGASNWLHLYSQSTDPAKLGTYATQRVQTGTGALCATGADTSLALAMGGVHNNGTSYTFNSLLHHPDAGDLPGHQRDARDDRGELRR